MSDEPAMSWTVRAIGTVSSPRDEMIDDDWGAIEATISLVPPFGPDAIDGTPVLDIKPYMAELGPRGPVSQPTWSHELMADYY